MVGSEVEMVQSVLRDNVFLTGLDFSSICLYLVERRMEKMVSFLERPETMQMAYIFFTWSHPGVCFWGI